MTKLGRITPILRIFDEAKAREFYVDFLGFKVDWEHRFEPDSAALHASVEGRLHHSSFGALWRRLALARTCGSKFRASMSISSTPRQAYKNSRPGIEDTPWGTREMTISDPFGNGLSFASISHDLSRARL